MDQANLSLVLIVSASLLGSVLSLLILWAVIRSAVLSALRAHERDSRRPL